MQLIALTRLQRVQPVAAFGCVHEFHLECVISQLLGDDSHFARQQVQRRQIRHKGNCIQNLCWLRGHCCLESGIEPVSLRGNRRRRFGALHFGMTKEEAVEQIGALTRDRDFIKRYLSGEYDATVEMKTLHAAVHR